MGIGYENAGTIVVNIPRSISTKKIIDYCINWTNTSQGKQFIEQEECNTKYITKSNLSKIIHQLKNVGRYSLQISETENASMVILTHLLVNHEVEEPMNNEDYITLVNADYYSKKIGKSIFA